MRYTGLSNKTAPTEVFSHLNRSLTRLVQAEGLRP